MRRGNLVAAVLPGGLGKPRPAFIVQADAFNEAHPTVVLLPLTSDLHAAPLIRILVEPSESNGLRAISQIMIDKPMTIRRDKIGKVIGRLDDDTILRVSRALAVWMGIA
jgi:mRNA interferase MazF